MKQQPFAFHGAIVHGDPEMSAESRAAVAEVIDAATARLAGRVEPSPLRALTLWRPWPWSILHGGKRIENRPWAPWKSIVGKRIALHAGKTWDAGGAAFIRNLCPSMPMPDPPGAHPAGVIVGLARVVGSVHIDDGAFPSGMDRRWFFGPYGWLLEDVAALREPVPCKGAQGLWTVPPDVAARVLEQTSEVGR